MPGAPTGPTAPGAARRGRVRSADAGGPREADGDDGEAEHTGPVQVSVRLLDPDDNPLAGATVTTYPVEGSSQVVVSDSRGRLTVTVGDEPLFVVVSRGKLVSGRVRVRRREDPDAVQDITVELAPAVVIRGVVVRPDGTPCPDVHISIGGRGRNAPEVVATSSGGEFTFPARQMNPREDALTATSDVTDEEAVARIDWTQPEPFARIVMPWRVDVVGRCITPDGSRLTESDARTAAATFKLSGVESPGTATVSQTVGDEEWEATVSWQGPGPVISLGDVVFRPPTQLRGVVTDASGVPVAETAVCVRGRYSQLTVYTDTEGRFELPRALREGESLLVRAFLEPAIAADGTEGSAVRAWTIVERSVIGSSAKADVRIVVTPNPVARFRLVDAAGSPIRTGGAARPMLPDLSPRAVVDGDLVTFALVGPPPWEVDVTDKSGRSKRVVIAEGESLERTVVIGD